ncbi:MAG: hypothetical protein KatS3mg015_2498 [Fimbriimonadales bacterium]|nr:MAG: hypothetical protein KatS3mg015_2498 [Fimbriimonadales bacterium]
MTTLILGAPDPEMQEIERLARLAGARVVYALVGRERVHPANAYRVDGLSEPVGDGRVAAVECDGPAVPETAARIDHHRPGDPGHGAPPERFLPASSVGQVLRWLHDGPEQVVPPVFSPPGTPWGAWAPAPEPCPTCGRAECEYAVSGEIVVSREVASGWTLRGERYTGFGDERLPWALDVSACVVLAAAADHCLAHAYAGRCPGVDPEALMRWRVETRAAHQGRAVADVLADVERARAMLRAAPRVVEASTLRPYLGVDVRDLRPGRGVPCAEHGPSCPGTLDGCWGDVPELPEAAAREGIPFLARPRPRAGETAKTVLQSAPPEAIREFLARAGEGAYGDPERGFAGVAGEL